jgi:hypothetical protein
VSVLRLTHRAPEDQTALERYYRTLQDVQALVGRAYDEVRPELLPALREQFDERQTDFLTFLQRLQDVAVLAAARAGLVTFRASAPAGST